MPHSFFMVAESLRSTWNTECLQLNGENTSLSTCISQRQSEDVCLHLLEGRSTSSITGCTGTPKPCLGVQSSFVLSGCAESADSAPQLCCPNLTFRLLSSLQLHSFQNSNRMEANLLWQLPCWPGIALFWRAAQYLKTWKNHYITQKTNLLLCQGYPNLGYFKNPLLWKHLYIQLQGKQLKSLQKLHHYKANYTSKFKQAFSVTHLSWNSGKRLIAEECCKQT